MLNYPWEVMGILVSNRPEPMVWIDLKAGGVPHTLAPISSPGFDAASVTHRASRPVAQ